MNENPIKIGITQGDINGIGLEVIMKALSDNKINEFCTPVVYGASKAASFHKSKLELQDFTMQVSKKLEQINLKKSNFINIWEQEVTIELGQSSPQSDKLSEMALVSACKDLKSKEIDAIVTAPINPKNIQTPTFKFKGQTEFFAQQFNAPNAMVILVANDLRVGLVSRHLPAAEVGKVLTKELILKRIKTLHQSLTVDFACTNPTIAVLSLSSDGTDKSNTECLRPAIDQAFSEHINAFGPFPADKFMQEKSYRKFDAVLAITNDQGMMLFQSESKGEGVFFTAGMPIVLTAPEHDTRYDIAGQNKADASSMRNAIYLAMDILKNRKIYSTYAKK